jgi:chorismate synthase
MLQLLTCGESHGKYLSAILEGMPSGLAVDLDFIAAELFRRQLGYGRGGRQRIEKDKVEITGGVYKGLTTGAPLGFLLENKDVTIDKLPQLFRPRPGHADLGGALKYNEGIREVLERASARETVMRVAAGGVLKLFLKEFGIEVTGHVIQIGGVKLGRGLAAVTFDEIVKGRKGSNVNCISRQVEKLMVAEIQSVMAKKDSIGGIFEIRVCGVPAGLGSHVHYIRKLDGRIAQGLMSMQSVKAVEVGLGVETGERYGAEVHDEIFYDSKQGYYHKTNRAGGIIGGMTNGEEISVRATMKPIATLRRELQSVNMKTKRPDRADFERSDVCAVPAGSVVGEAIVSFEVAQAFLEKFGGDSMAEIERNYKSYLKQIRG